MDAKYCAPTLVPPNFLIMAARMLLLSNSKNLSTFISSKFGGFYHATVISLPLQTSKKSKILLYRLAVFYHSNLRLFVGFYLPKTVNYYRHFWDCLAG